MPNILYYPEFHGLKIKNRTAIQILQRFKNDELRKLDNGNIDGTNRIIFDELMRQSYYNWSLRQNDFKKLQIQKIITDRNNLSLDDY